MMGAVRFFLLFFFLRRASRQPSCQAASVRWDVCLNSLGFKGGGSWRAGGGGEEEKKKVSQAVLWNHQVYFPALCKLLKSCASLALPY